MKWLMRPAKLKYVETGINPDGSVSHRAGDPVPESKKYTNWDFISDPSGREGQTWR